MVRRTIPALVLAFSAFALSVAASGAERVCVTANEWASFNPLTPGRLSLACPAGEVVASVDFASYGTPRGSCGGYRTSSCNATNSLSAMRAACLGKANCSVADFPSVFGDPCSGTAKRLYVQATCAAPLPPAPSSTTASVCGTSGEYAPSGYPNPGTLSLACPAGQAIESVDFASYGTPNGSCGSFTASSCDASSSVSVVKANCVGKASCSLTGFAALFGDPCAGTVKRIYAQVRCGSGATPIPSPTPSPVPSVKPSPTPTPSPSPSPRPSPAATPAPSAAPGSLTASSVTVIPTSEDDLLAPGRGGELWNYEDQAIDLPAEGSGFHPNDAYFRFGWLQFEKTKGVYDFSAFDSQINDAIANGRKFAFGIMTFCPGCGVGNGAIQVGGATAYFPSYLHTEMQAGTVKDWISDGAWVPNWNSEAYLSAYEKLLVAINAHIDAGSYNGVAYKNAINYIDVRGYGSWGEWHMGGAVNTDADYPSGTKATAASLKRIIAAHVNGFPNHQLVTMLSTFDGNRLQNTMNPPEVGYYALTARNNVGLLGWRRDNWGALDSYLRSYTDQSNVSYSGLSFQTEIMNRWQFAPVNGEPMNGGTDAGGSCAYYDLENQVRRYHAASFGNGNYIGADSAACARTNIRAGFKASGYRLVLNAAARTAAVNAGRAMSVRLNWRNVGIAPTYENWNVEFDLRNSAGSTVWTGRSSMALRLYLPESADRVVTDNFALPAGLANGNYTLYLVVRDPNGFRKPLPLAIRNRTADGAYSLGSVVLGN